MPHARHAPRIASGAIRAGAAGFLLKDSPAESLAEAVRTVHRGQALLSPAVTRRLMDAFAAAPSPDAASDPALETLTPREREVLVLIARGMSNAETARSLYLGEATVKSHVTNILAKLGLRDRVQAVVFAYEAGLVRAGGGAQPV